MSTEIKSLGKHSLVFMLGTTLSKLTSFLMLPIYTRFLTPSDYGTLELLQMTIDLVGLLAGMSIAGALFRFYPDIKDEAERNRLVSTASIGIASIAAVSGLIGFLASPVLKELILPDHGRVLYFRLFFLVYILTAIEGVPLLYLRALNRSVAVVAVNLVKLLVLLALNLYFVVYLRMGVAGVLWSNLIGTGLTSLALSVYLFSRVGFAFSRLRFRELVRYGYPLAAGSVANFFLMFSDRYFLNHYGTVADVGIYSLAYKFAFVLSAFAFGPFMMAWGPQRFFIAKQTDASQLFGRVFLYMNLGLASLGLIIALFAPDVLRIMAASTFRSAGVYVPALIIGQILQHWTTFHSVGLQLGKTTGLYAMTAAFGIAAALFFNYLLIPSFGIVGAIWATLLAYTMRFVLVHVLSQREFQIDYGWARLALLYAVVGTGFLSRWLLGPVVLHVSIGVSGVILIATISVVYRLVLSEAERSGVREALLRTAVAGLSLRRRAKFT
jgi:O-antigen/teichoic acid export membrane protein